ncbi:phosphate ABC transporter substrate-binding protein PstS [Paenarthrobacter sp. Z7-10]|uniref:phosphate ABC transporter substrate-binding protein PstS n=1 Tax=Paenarthrobacter sp. Z7-10 TaxID=2787635 RepID=UPI0022A9E390|nr:phosphate ABC transporter substrate-binding protein PstS [Paenarthrobacter sp. Z7-10]MCZ2401982.1 phosphate ABC transporter substrate-binding protein PstS [Paenarthrobacter sp. Z7-10]
MKVLRFGRVAAVIAAGALALTACGGSNTGASAPGAGSNSGGSSRTESLSGTITAGGSSAQANAQAAWTAGFKAQAPGVTVNYDKSQGSGGGVTNFLAGTYDFAGSDAYLKPDQAAKAQEKCGPGGAVNLPVYTDGVAIIFNLKGVDKLQLSSDTLAKIFAQKIKSWDDAAIKADNPGVTLPSTAITTVTRSDGSGTTQNFSNYLHQVAPGVWTSPVSNKWPIAGSSAQQGGSGVVNTVKAGDGTIGYADHSSIGDVKAASIKAGSTYVAFSQDAVTKAIAAAVTPAKTTVAGDLSQDIDYTKLTSGDAYPIPLISYDILCTKFKDAKQAKLVTAYIGYIISDQGQKIAAKNAGSAPIPADLATKISATLKTIS